MTQLLNIQEVFDAVVKHARKQKKRSVKLADNQIQCMYRSDDGYKCFAGIFIDDNDYKPELEGHTVLELQYYFEKKVNSIIQLRQIQAIHDQNYPDEWEELFREHARIYRLEYSPPEEVNAVHNPEL